VESDFPVDLDEVVDDVRKAAHVPAQDVHALDLLLLSFEVCAPQAGIVVGIDNFQIARIARLAGAPKVAGAGVDLLHKLGDTVAEGEPLYRVHASYPADLEFARQQTLRDSAYALGGPEQVPHVFVEF